MSLLVMKFGGTSVGSPERIRQSAQIVRDAHRQHAIVVVVSALSGITDLTIRATSLACGGDREALDRCLDEIAQRHRAAIEVLPAGATRDAVSAEVCALTSELKEFCSALLMFRNTTPQVLDTALSMGERMSAPIFAGHLAESGIDARPFDSREFLVTDDSFGDAAPDMEATTRLAQERLLPVIAEGAVPVITGYRGATAAGQPTTLGRGGSDFSATILGAALGCDEIWIWTDVDGVMSADPRLCPDAATLDEVTFAEAMEMSYYGAKVIHRKAIRPAMDSGIPVLIRNSFDPQTPGTRIASAAKRNGQAVKAVAGVSQAALVTLNLRNGGHFEDLFGRLFLGLGHERIDVLFSTHSSSESALGLVFREPDLERALGIIERSFRREIEHSVVAPLSVQRDVAVIAVMGEAMKGKCGILARLFTAVAACGVSVIAVAQGASEINICFAVPASSAAAVIQAVHAEFLGQQPFHLSKHEDDDEPKFASRCCS